MTGSEESGLGGGRGLEKDDLEQLLKEAGVKVPEDSV